MTGAIFLDRDGVIIEDRPNYVRNWDEVTFLPGVFTALQKLVSIGRPIILITNQSGIGRGIVTAELVADVNQKIATEIAEHGGRLDAIYYCPHHPDAGCECRKPRPGMLLQAARDLGLNLEASVMVGDSLRDMEAARATGAAGILVRTGHGAEHAELVANRFEPPVTLVADLNAAADCILGRMQER